MAEQKGLKIIEAQIKSTDQDMSAQVTQFKAAGVKAIALTVAPGQTASVAAVAESQGLDVPILGNNPVFAPACSTGRPAGAEDAPLRRVAGVAVRQAAGPAQGVPGRLPR